MTWNPQTPTTPKLTTTTTKLTITTTRSITTTTDTVKNIITNSSQSNPNDLQNADNLNNDDNYASDTQQQEIITADKTIPTENKMATNATKTSKRQHKKQKQKPKTMQDRVGWLIRAYVIKTVWQEICQQVPLVTQLLAQQMSKRLKTRHKLLQ